MALELPKARGKVTNCAVPYWKLFIDISLMTIVKSIQYPWKRAANSYSAHGVTHCFKSRGSLDDKETSRVNEAPDKSAQRGHFVGHELEMGAGEKFPARKRARQ